MLVLLGLVCCILKFDGTTLGASSSVTPSPINTTVRISSIGTASTNGTTAGKD